MTSVRVKLPQRMSGNVKMPWSTKFSFSGAFADAGIATPIVVSATTVTTRPFNPFRMWFAPLVRGGIGSPRSFAHRSLVETLRRRGDGVVGALAPPAFDVR